MSWSQGILDPFQVGIQSEFVEKIWLDILYIRLSFLSLYNAELCALSIDKKVSDYDQEIPQSQTADNAMAPRGRAAQPSRDTRKTN